MDDVTAKAEIMRGIGRMADRFPKSWNEASTWFDCAQALGDLVFEIGGIISPVQLSVLMWAAALAHRQCKRERASQGGEA